MGLYGPHPSAGPRNPGPADAPWLPAWRWVVARTHSWTNRFRRLLIRWEKKVENDLALVHFACAWIAFRAAAHPSSARRFGLTIASPLGSQKLPSAPQNPPRCDPTASNVIGRKSRYVVASLTPCAGGLPSAPPAPGRGRTAVAGLKLRDGKAIVLLRQFIPESAGHVHEASGIEVRRAVGC